MPGLMRIPDWVDKNPPVWVTRFADYWVKVRWWTRLPVYVIGLVVILGPAILIGVSVYPGLGVLVVLAWYVTIAWVGHHVVLATERAIQRGQPVRMSSWERFDRSTAGREARAKRVAREEAIRDKLRKT